MSLSVPSPVTALRRPQVQAWLSTAARLLLAGVLAAAGWLKLADPDASVRAVRAYRLLPETLAKATGFGLPVLELALAVLLLTGLGTRVAAVLSGLLMVVFVVGVGSAWARGLAIDCGCFGGGGQVDQGSTRYLQEILRDLGLLGAACWLAYRPASHLSADRALGLTD